MKLLICFVLGFSMSQAPFPLKGQRTEDLPQLISDFQAAHGLEEKERILREITTRFPRAGPTLLKVAEGTTDVDTRWMAIRGIGFLKYKKAAPFLVDSLHSDHHYVRANAARALGDMKINSAAPALITLLKDEQDGGVIEQASLALGEIGAKNAVPVLKLKVSHPSSETRMWVLQAIGVLGSRDDVPFLAGYLNEQNTYIGMAAAQAIERITGEDFGFPKRQGPMSPAPGLQNARQWWATHKSSWAAGLADQHRRQISARVPA
jgi:HEAT repeats